MFTKIIPLLKFVILFLLVSCSSGSDLDRTSWTDLKSLNVVTNDNIFYPSFSAEFNHYAVSCGDGNIFSVNLASENAGTEIYINNVLSGIGSSNRNFEGYSSENDIVIELRNDNLSKKYYLHCITKDFPLMEITTKTKDVEQGLIITSPNAEGKGYLLILDNNGVPLYRKVVDGVVSDFKRHSNGEYSYALRDVANEFGQKDASIFLLTSEFKEKIKLKTIGLNQTDNHDFLISPSGTYILLSYNSNYRDMRPQGLSENELTRDSVIQEQNAQGQVLFQWDSWDHIDVNNCLNHRFPDDYAHINSLQLLSDGNLIASLRGCSMVLKIDRANGTGATIWDIGGFHPSLQITGDPYGEFCGQHTASLDYNGDLFIFDNGGHCNGSRESTSGTFSRALQYSIDLDAGQAKFKRDYSFNNSYSDYSVSGGSFFPTLKGNWLINWSRGIFDVTEITQNGDVAFQFFFSDLNGEKIRLYRVYKEYDILLPANIDGSFVYYYPFR